MAMKKSLYVGLSLGQYGVGPLGDLESTITSYITKKQNTTILKEA